MEQGWAQSWTTHWCGVSVESTHLEVDPTPMYSLDLYSTLLQGHWNIFTLFGLWFTAHFLLVYHHHQQQAAIHNFGRTFKLGFKLVLDCKKEPKNVLLYETYLGFCRGIWGQWDKWWCPFWVVSACESSPNTRIGFSFHFNFDNCNFLDPTPSSFFLRDRWETAPTSLK